MSKVCHSFELWHTLLIPNSQKQAYDLSLLSRWSEKEFMISVRTIRFIAVLLIGQLGLNACQTNTDIVLPSKAISTNPKVTVSDWIAITDETWTISAKAPQLHVAGFVDSAVTNSVVENGLVVAFYRHSAEDDVYPLPVSIGNQAISFTYYAMNDKGIISFQQKAGQTLDGEYRWIVVPKEAAKNVNWTDYDEVKQALNLKE
jgi:hypothetical protein